MIKQVLITCFAILLVSCSSTQKLEEAKEITTETTVKEDNTEVFYLNIAVDDFPEQEILFAFTEALLNRNFENKIILIPKRYESYQEIETAFKQNEVDLYWGYTATILNHNNVKLVPPYDSTEVYELSKKTLGEQGVSISKVSPIQNDYALAVRSDNEKLLSIISMSDLSTYSKKLTLGLDDDFLAQRENDSLKDLSKYYAIRSNKHIYKSYHSRSEMYHDLRFGNIDVALVYKTDHQIDFDRLRLLKDNKNFFAPYNLVSIYHNEFTTKYPNLVHTLDLVAENLTNDVMRYLLQRYQVDGMSLESIVAEAIDCSRKYGIVQTAFCEQEQKSLTPEKDD